MDLDRLYDRILARVDHSAYLALADAVPAAQREAMSEIGALVQTPGVSADRARARAAALHAEGRIDRLMLLSALHVIAMSPGVRDYAEAARLIGEREQLALGQGGPELPLHLASVERHRGALAFYQGQYEIALDYFSRAFERQRSAGNLSNVLITLLRLGEPDEALSLFRQVRATLPAPLVDALVELIRADPDLAPLRPEL